MSAAKFRLQLQSFGRLLIVTLVQLSVIDFEHEAIAGSKVSTISNI